MAFKLSSDLGLCSSQETDRIHKHLIANGLPTTVDKLGIKGLSPEAVTRRMHQDKKVFDGRLTFILTRGIGHAFIENNVKAETVTAMLKTLMRPGPAK